MASAVGFPLVICLDLEQMRVRMSKEATFEPQLTAFYCIYCGYMAADTAGALHVQYPANVKFVRMPCTGKTDIRYILEAFEQGADAVYVVACPVGNCHHVRGNERAAARLERARDLLQEIGLERERLGLFFMSGSQGQTFAAAAQAMTERTRKLGRSPLAIDRPEGEEPLGQADEDVGFRGRKMIP